MRDTHLRLAAVAAALVLLGAVFAIQGCSKGEPASDAGGQSSEQTPLPGEEPMHTSDVKVTGDEIAVITTKKGVIKFQFYPQDAPNHVASFIELAREGFYDGTSFHRVVKEPQPFVVQGGDPYSKTGEGPIGTGGPGWRLKAEFNDRKHLEGTVAMARSQDPDSAGSQFYICLAPLPMLDGQYTVFGQVIEGMDVVKSIDQGDVMESVRIETRK